MKWAKCILQGVYDYVLQTTVDWSSPPLLTAYFLTLFSCRCQQILTGAEVAVKFVNRRRRRREETRKEFELLVKASGHPAVISSAASGLFATSSSDAIILSLVSGVSLFEHLCEEPRYSEAAVSRYMRQLLEALQHLHHKKIIHLDLKVSSPLRGLGR